MATMSVVRDRKRSQSSEFFSYFAAPYGFARTISLFLWDVVLERRAARRQLPEHLGRGREEHHPPGDLEVRAAVCDGEAPVG